VKVVVFDATGAVAKISSFLIPNCHNKVKHEPLIRTAGRFNIQMFKVKVQTDTVLM
jgi:hypothetical protein